MFDGLFLMGCAAFAVAMFHYRRLESKWAYFLMGMVFAFGSREFIPALAHWMG
jgi:hypothetical protein